jgi:amino acid permease
MLAVLFAAAKVWHYWIAVAVAIGAVLTVVSLVANYFRKVQAVKYPKKR